MMREVPHIFFQERTETTPFIIFDRKNEKFEITGVSVPEKGLDFYKPALAWINDYAENPLKKTKFVISLEYFNISSSKMILFIFYKLMEIQQNGNVVEVDWFYSDEELFEAGTDYEYITRLNFNYHKIVRKKLADKTEESNG